MNISELKRVVDKSIEDLAEVSSILSYIEKKPLSATTYTKDFEADIVDDIRQITQRLQESFPPIKTQKDYLDQLYERFSK